MRIFITGGTGFVGSHLTHKLIYNGHEVTVGGVAPKKSVLQLPESVNREKIDITDPETLDFSSYDAVIHLVGLSPLRKPSIPYQEVHLKGTENVLEACKKSNTDRYIHMSALGADPEASTEYLRTKGKAQKLVEDSELDWTIFQPSVIFGEGGQFLDFTEKLVTPYITGLPGGGKNKFQPIYVEDIGDLFVETVEEDHHLHNIYEIGGPDVLTLKEIAKLIEKQKGRNLKVLPVPMFAAKTGLTISEYLNFLPFGLDQYRSLKIDNVVDEDSLEFFHKDKDELLTLEDYLKDR